MGLLGRGPTGGMPGILKSIYHNMCWSFCFVPKNIFLELFSNQKALDMTKIKKRTYEVVVVTGANRGVGPELIKKLMQLEMDVIAGANDVEEMKTIYDKIRASGVKTGSLQVIHLDLCSFASVREFVNEVHKINLPVRALINNADSTMATASYDLTDNGFEKQFQVNYLSPFLITNLLLPQIKKAGSGLESDPGVVIDVSSVAQYQGTVEFDNLNGEKWYSKFKKYYDSKLAQTSSSHFLATKLKQRGANVRINSLHPGIVGAGLWNSSWWGFRPIRWLLQFGIKSPAICADDIIHAAFDPSVQETTAAFFNNREVDPMVPLLEWTEMEKLWNVTCEMVKIPDFISQEPEPERNILQSLNINLDDAIKVQNIGTLLQQYFIRSALSQAMAAQAPAEAQSAMVNSSDVSLKIEEVADEPGLSIPGPSGDHCTPVHSMQWPPQSELQDKILKLNAIKIALD